MIIHKTPRHEARSRRLRSGGFVFESFLNLCRECCDDISERFGVVALHLHLILQRDLHQSQVKYVDGTFLALSTSSVISDRAHHKIARPTIQGLLLAVNPERDLCVIEF